MARTMSMLVVLHTPVTSAPNHLAICTANIPTSPDAPTIKTFWSGLIPPVSRSPWRAVMAPCGTAAACSKVRFDGLGASVSAGFSQGFQRHAIVLVLDGRGGMAQQVA